MKKEEIVLKRYKERNNNLCLIINLHQSIFNDTHFENNLIYFDPNFEQFLRSLLNSNNHFFYVVEINERIEGFLHIRFIDNYLFLNNIAINNNFKGKGLGKRMLIYALKDIYKKYKTNFDFKLDVFESNQFALKWYEKLGFTIESKIKWFKFQTKSFKRISRFEKHKDENNFSGIYDGKEKIGTIILDNLVLHHSDKINEIDFSKYNNIISHDNSFQKLSIIDELEGTVEIIDTSVRMSNKIENIISKLL